MNIDSLVKSLINLIPEGNVKEYERLIDYDSRLQVFHWSECVLANSFGKISIQVAKQDKELDIVVNAQGK